MGVAGHLKDATWSPPPCLPLQQTWGVHWGLSLENKLTEPPMVSLVCCVTLGKHFPSLIDQFNNNWSLLNVFSLVKYILYLVLYVKMLRLLPDSSNSLILQNWCIRNSTSQIYLKPLSSLDLHGYFHSQGILGFLHQSPNRATCLFSYPLQLHFYIGAILYFYVIYIKVNLILSLLCSKLSNVFSVLVEECQSP